MLSARNMLPILVYTHKEMHREMTLFTQQLPAGKSNFGTISSPQVYVHDV